MRPLLVARTWFQAAILVFLFGSSSSATSRSAPTRSSRRFRSASWIRPAGVVFTREDVIEGQRVFLKNGLMQYGSIFGHGAYLGPDYTADYLRRSATIVRDTYGGSGSDRARDQPSGSSRRTATIPPPESSASTRRRPSHTIR